MKGNHHVENEYRRDCILGVWLKSYVKDSINAQLGIEAKT